MNKKGFTLIELLAVIVILGIIVSVSVVTIIRNFKNSKQKLGYENAEHIVESSEAYFAQYGGTCVSIKELTDAEILDERLSNPRTGDLKWDSGEKESTQVCRGSYDKQSEYTTTTVVVTENDSTASYMGYKFDGFAYVMKSIPSNETNN